MRSASSTLDIAAITDTGKVRLRNEDRALALHLDGRTALIAVADGVGGVSGGHLASEAAMQTLVQYMTDAHADRPLEALAAAFTRANAVVRDLQTRTRMHMATTLVAAIVRGRTAWIANVGDSRGYVLDGELVQITRDHSLIAEQLAAGAIPSVDAAASEDQNVITRGIGVIEAVMPDFFGPLELPPGSILLLCSDGMCDVLDDAAIALALGSTSASASAARLVEMANNAGGPDNIAVALCKG